MNNRWRWTLLLFACALAAVTHAADRPNIVIFFMDDMGYSDLRIDGALDARTPHLDRLAREGEVRPANVVLVHQIEKSFDIGALESAGIPLLVDVAGCMLPRPCSISRICRSRSSRCRFKSASSTSSSVEGLVIRLG